MIINTKKGGITPTGNINITTTSQVDVADYATAKVVDSDLVAENIKKDVNILGIVGSYEGGQTLPGKTVTITGACSIDVSDVGASGYAVRIGGFNSTDEHFTIAMAWGSNGTDTKEVALANAGNLSDGNITVGNYQPYANYDPITQTVNLKSSYAKYCIGTWQFIPRIN